MADEKNNAFTGIDAADANEAGAGAVEKAKAAAREAVEAAEAADTTLDEEQTRRLAELEADARAAAKANESLAAPVAATAAAPAAAAPAAHAAPAAAQPTQVQPAQPTQVQPAQRVPQAPVPPAQAGSVGNTQVYTAQQQAQAVAAQQRAYQQQQQAQAAAARYVPATAGTHAAVATGTDKPKVGLKSFLFGLLGGLLAAGALFGVLSATGFFRGSANTASTGSAATAATTPTSSQSITITPNDEVTVAQAVAAKALPSVVSVYCTYYNGQGMGSGVILDTQGNIITNYHVVEDAEAISVTIEGKSYEATVVGTDASSDLAVIRAELDGATVTPIERGDSSALKVGDWVMTVGSPFGLDQSVSAGIVSSLYRNETMTSNAGVTIYANLIQVDAAINPGNSGGALVNSQGQLVGISTLFSSDTESFAGIGFAIPGNYALDIAEKIMSGNAVTHAYIGLGMQTVDAQSAQANHFSVNQGAYVAEVYENSPAAQAGIQVGDIVVSFAGEQIQSADGVILAVRSHSIGETVAVGVVRGDEELTFNVTLGSDEELQERQRQEQEQYEQQQQQQDNSLDQGWPFGNGNGNGNGNGEGFTEEDWQQLQEWYDMLFNQENRR